MVETFEDGEKKYGRVYKVAGPRKYSQRLDKYSFDCHSGRGGMHVRVKDVRVGQSWLGQTRRRNH